MLAKDVYTSPTHLRQTGSVLAVAGTDPRRFRDLLDDFDILIGRPRWGARYRSARAYLSIHPEIDTVVGHSLGGTVAELLHKDLGLKSYSFNPGVSPFGPIREADHRYRTYFDPVSVSGARGSWNSRATHWDPHGIANFLW